ncbi:MAG: hypothetical protein F6J93_15785 [Oscillatoria sp. SIO1A7]|nr:hypothetical protein [Oscillatoria sp. SIO1A7]
MMDNAKLFYELMAAHCVIGTVAALVAYKKGRNFGRWLGLGLIGGTVALIAASLLPGSDRIS